VVLLKVEGDGVYYVLLFICFTIYMHIYNSVKFVTLFVDGVWYAMIIYEHEKRKSNDE